jgi:type IV pilus assembly protein PilC
MAIDITKKSAKAPSHSAGSGWLQMELQLGPVYSMRNKEVLYREIGLMLGSGLALKDTLELLANEQKGGKRKAILEQIAADIRKGDNLEIAIGKSGAFSEYECVSIRMGEESGRLPDIVHQLGDYFKPRVAQRRTLTGALTYPLVILATSFGAVGFMLVYMVPMFRDVFSRTGKQLPVITQIVVSASDAVVASAGWVLLLALGLSYAMMRYRKHAALRSISSKVLLKLPIIGDHYRTGVLMQWCGAMALMLGSGVSLINALQLSGRLTHDAQLKATLTSIEEKLLKGQYLYQTMKGSPFFDSRFILLVQVAEEAHALNSVFSQLAEQYREDMEHRSKMLGTLLEPIIILFLGAIVGFILLAMYLPIFQMGAG